MKNNTLKNWAILAGIVVYIIAVFFGDIMFLQVVHKIFPEGIFGTAATLGALTTAFSSIALLLAIHFWVSPGAQFHVAIGFWFVNFIVLALNSMLAFQIQMNIGHMMDFWLPISPATPVISIGGWGIIFLLDLSHFKRHAELEFAKHAQNNFLKKLREQGESEEVLDIIKRAAIAQANKIASEILDSPIVASNGNGTKPALPEPTTTFGMEVDAPKVSARKGRA